MGTAPRTTADLPDGFRLDPIDAATLAAVRRSGLRLTLACIHGRDDCAACIVAASHRLPARLGKHTPAAPRR